MFLHSKSIRLSSLDRMKDARESRSWYASLRVDVDDEVTNDEHLRWCAEIDEALRQRAKAARFIGDRYASEPAGDADQFHRGYARARMWDQYVATTRGHA
jgi:hypothetical protein